MAGTPEPAGSASGDDRDRQLWQRLEEMMRVGKIYRNSDISLDRLAEMLGTNRTYVSRVINRYAGTTFYNYIHSARIDDASRILSDASSEIQLQDLAMEMGYNSQSSFYRVLQGLCQGDGSPSVEVQGGVTSYKSRLLTVQNINFTV